MGTLCDESQVLVRSRSCIDRRECWDGLLFPYFSFSPMWSLSFLDLCISDVNFPPTVSNVHRPHVFFDSLVATLFSLQIYAVHSILKPVGLFAMTKTHFETSKREWLAGRLSMHFNVEVVQETNSSAISDIDSASILSEGVILHNARKFLLDPWRLWSQTHFSLSQVTRTGPFTSTPRGLAIERSTKRRPPCG